MLGCSPVPQYCCQKPAVDSHVCPSGSPGGDQLKLPIPPEGSHPTNSKVIGSNNSFLTGIILFVF